MYICFDIHFEYIPYELKNITEMLFIGVGCK